jgi:CheY-like chemotaxis protein
MNAKHHAPRCCLPIPSSVPPAGRWSTLANPPGRAAMTRVAPPTKCGDPRQILCIQDSTANIQSLQRIFSRRADLDLVAVHGLRVGLEIAAFQRFDLIVIDLDFQQESGRETLSCVRRDPQFGSTPVVAISTRPLPGDVCHALEIGFDECLPASTDGESLLHAVDRLLPQPGAPSRSGHDSRRPAAGPPAASR